VAGESCRNVCNEHSGMEEKDVALEGKYNQILWILGLCGAVLSILASILIYQNTSIRDTLNDMKVSIATANIQFAAAAKAEDSIRKDIEDLKRDVESLKAGARRTP
jgi:peptidoglycan hydrolase CwlO-like protein